ncbi:MAG: PhzF family phenazine biosynthesis protein [Pseudarcicella sp.]|jgi:PhzF family phenazine biosynthesis protein|nr:PhzF family phenazine biosynthesis protein [Pseudarcicella sp.]MBP6411068.1 PhzF family phenazine biosynthesis protein [Pseudarcicella sp.]
MKLKIFQIDAFAEQIFGGNPAAVVPLDSWISDELMQKIAFENNLAETVFFVKNNQEFDIRWFTPTVEVPLCGHATLAAAWVIFNQYNYLENTIIFQSQSGKLTVQQLPSGKIELDFPAISSQPFTEKIPFGDFLGISPIKAFTTSSNLLLEYGSEEEIIQVKPDFEKLKQLEFSGIIITSKGNTTDFVSRFFAPKIGINEDPATGSAQASLIPFWSKKLSKTTMTAHQLSERKGVFEVKLISDRVKMTGNAFLFMAGEIYI